MNSEESEWSPVANVPCASILMSIYIFWTPSGELTSSDKYFICALIRNLRGEVNVHIQAEVDKDLAEQQRCREGGSHSDDPLMKGTGIVLTEAKA